MKPSKVPTNRGGIAPWRSARSPRWDLRGARPATARAAQEEVFVHVRFEVACPEGRLVRACVYSVVRACVCVCQCMLVRVNPHVFVFF